MRHPRNDAGLPEIAGDAVLIAGGARAILLQLADPAVGRGVARHSDFEDRVLDRLWATLAYVYAIVYGDDGEREKAVRSVNRAHAPVVGPADGGAPAYSAFDPQLQLWVAATLYDTAVVVLERTFGPLTEATADALYLRYAELGAALQMPPELWPADRMAFDTYWQQRVGELVVGDEVRVLSRRLMFPSTLPAHLMVAMPVARLVTAGLLPSRARALYRVRWNAGAESRVRAILRVTGLVWPLLPRPVRQWPKNRSLRSLHAAP